jgi:hypothetical protein
MARYRFQLGREPDLCVRRSDESPFSSGLSPRSLTKAPKRLASEVDFGAIKNRDGFTASPKAACGVRRDC